MKKILQLSSLWIILLSSLSHAAVLATSYECLNATQTYFVEGKTNYVWTVSEGGTIVSGQNTYLITVKWTTTGSKTVSVTYDGGSASLDVVVYALPTASITLAETSGTANDGVLCSGGSATLTGHGGTSYKWSNGASTASTTISSANTYTVTVTDGNGCKATANRTISISLESPNIWAANPNPVLGAPNNYYYTDLNKTNYTWAVSGGTINSGGLLNTSYIYIAWKQETGTSLNVKYTDSYGCLSNTTILPVTVAIPVTGLSISAPSVSIEKGKYKQLSATISPSNATNTTLNWSSSDESVATVDATGKVTAMSAGKCNIKVSTPDLAYNAYCEVTVTVPVSGLTLDPSSITLAAGEKKQLTASFDPPEAIGTITWSSSDNSLATVNSGLVIAISPGAVTITATSGIYSANCIVTIPVSVTYITLDQSSISVNIGDSLQLHPSISPSNASDTKVTWVSYSPGIATVDLNGYVKGIAKGVTSVAAITRDGNKIAICNVTVIKPVTSITISTTNTKKLVNGDTLHLYATVKPDDASDPNVVWHTNSPNIASIDQTGFVKIDNTAYGYASFTATSSNGVSASYGFSVYDSYGSISLNKDSISLAVNDTALLESNVYPTYAKVYWEPSVPQVASVDNGIVTAIAVGKTKIYAYMVTAKGEIRKDSCIAFVYVPITGVAFDNKQISLALGMQDKLSASVFPPNALDRTIIWSSSDPNIVSINDNGYVVAKAMGSATITVTAGSGKFSDQCNISVYFVNTAIDKASDQEFAVFPNPFNGDHLTIKFKRPSNEVKIKISDVLGRVVYQNDMLSGSEINIQPDFGHGIYMISIESDDDHFQTKVIVP